MNINRETLSNIIQAVLSSKRPYVAQGNGIVEVDTEALTAEIVKAVEAQATFESGGGERRFDPNNDEHVALACIRSTLASYANFDEDAKAAVDLLIQKAGMR